MTLFGYGGTTKAIAKKFGNCKIYDDSFNGVMYDKNGNEFLESEMFNPLKSDLEVTSPGIPPSNPLIKKAKNLMSEYDLFADTMPFSIWITGTNGKTTTTAMLEYLLEKRGGVAGGNIGTPLANLDEKANIWILETSSFTLHYTNKAKPNLYIVLPISDDHTSWHGGFKEYEEAKLKPIKTMLEGEIVILPKKYDYLETKATKVLYENSSDLSEYFDINTNKLNFSEPFLTDALLALASTKILFDEIDYKKINSFVVGAHRVEKFLDIQNRTWINDSKATNLDATLAALNGLRDKEVFLILGGDDKGADLEPLFQKLENHIKIFTIGTNSKKLINLAKQYDIRHLSCKNIENAISNISNEFLSCENQVALLSPAAASFDQFNSYAHRGDEFKRIVGNLS